MNLSKSFFAALVMIGACLAGQSQVMTPVAEPDLRPINVVVVGVTDFTSSDYKPDPSLKRSDTVGGQIEQRCQDIESFFQTTYGKRANIHLLCTPPETTKAELDKFFTRRFPKDAKGTMSVVFFMSHGEQVEGNGSLITPDLRIITSDTTHDDPDLTSLSFTKDVMSWLQSPPVGATIIVFVDTCHSGAVKNIQARRLGDLANEQGLFMNVMASSLPRDKSFAASFTKAILGIWRSKELCLNDAGLPNRIRNLIQDDSPVSLGAFEGRPTSIIRYQGSGCLYAPVKDDRLLLLYGGANLPDTIYRVLATSTNQNVSDGDLIGKSFEYVRLSEGEYDVAITEREVKSYTKHINLTGTNLTEIVYLQENLTTTNEAKANSIAADGAERLGHSSVEIASFRHRAADFYRTSGEFQKATEELAKLDATPEIYWAPPKQPLDGSNTAILAAKVVDNLARITASVKTTIPSEVLQASRCIVVAPSLPAGHVITGSRQGEGLATCRDSTGGWTDAITVKIEGGGSRWHLGKKPSDVIMLIMNESGKALLFSEDMKIGVEAKAKAGPVTNQSVGEGEAAAGIDILGYSIEGDKFRGQGLDGTTLKPEKDKEVQHGKGLDKALHDLTKAAEGRQAGPPQ